MSDPVNAFSRSLPSATAPVPECDYCGSHEGQPNTCSQTQCSVIVCTGCETEHLDDHRIAAKDDRDAEYVWGNPADDEGGF